MTGGSADGRRARVTDATRERNFARGVRGTERRAAGYSSSSFASRRDRRVETRGRRRGGNLQSRKAFAESVWRVPLVEGERIERRRVRDDDGDDGDDASSGGDDDDDGGDDDVARRTEG